MSVGGADRDISLLFDVFVLHQRVRSLLARALSGTGLRSDEYAVYSVLFERGPLTPTQLTLDVDVPVAGELADPDARRAAQAQRHHRRGRDRDMCRTIVSAAPAPCGSIAAEHSAHLHWSPLECSPADTVDQRRCRDPEL